MAPMPTTAPVSLTTALPGIPDHLDYLLEPATPDGAVQTLRSTAPDGPRFVAIPPDRYFPDYRPNLPSQALADLDLTDPAAARLVCLVSIPGGDVTAATANLLAPIVINPHTGRATQVILHEDDPDLIRQPLHRG